MSDPNGTDRVRSVEERLDKMHEERAKTAAARDALMEALRRKMQPSWRDLAWAMLLNGLATVVQYTLVGIGFHLGWSLLR